MSTGTGVLRGSAAATTWKYQVLYCTVLEDHALGYLWLSVVFPGHVILLTVVANFAVSALQVIYPWILTSHHYET